MKPKKPKSAPGKNKDGAITENEKRFCEEYIKDYNASRAYRAVFNTKANANSIGVESCRLRQVPRVWEYLQFLQKDVEKLAGLSRARVLQAHQEIAFTSIAHLHKSWITRKEFEELTPQEKMAIQEIDTKVKTTYTEAGKKVEVEYVRIKLYDRQKSLEAIARMVGYDEPSKLELVGNKELIAQMFPFGK